MGFRDVREGVPPQSRLAPSAPTAAPDDRGRAERETQAEEVQAAAQAAQQAAIVGREVAGVAMRAPHEGRDLGAVAGIQTVPVVAAGTQDFEDDEPGNKASEHGGALPEVCPATRSHIAGKLSAPRGILDA
jgi:hypothetical protein